MISRKQRLCDDEGLFTIDIPIFRAMVASYPCIISTKNNETFKVTFRTPALFCYEVSMRNILNVSNINKERVLSHINNAWDSICGYKSCILLMNRLVKEGVIPIELAGIIKEYSFTLYQQKKSIGFSCVDLHKVITSKYGVKFI